MTDIALSLLALIAGGVTLELFAAAQPPLSEEYEAESLLSQYLLDEEVQCGNPS